MNPSCTVHFFQCDAAVGLYKEYHAGEPIDCEVTGRGGTSFVPVVEEIEKLGLDIPCLVYLTDGYGTFPDSPPDYEVLWIMTTDQKAPFGEIVRMEMDNPR
jgi:predicted metal-dependent peptidase